MSKKVSSERSGLGDYLPDNGRNVDTKSEVVETDPIVTTTEKFLVDIFSGLGRADRSGGEIEDLNKSLDYYAETAVEWMGREPIPHEQIQEIVKELHNFSREKPGAFIDAFFGMSRAGTWKSYVAVHHNLKEVIDEILREFSPETPLERMVADAAGHEFSENNEANENPFFKKMIDPYEDLYAQYGEALRRQVNFDLPLHASESVFPMASNAAVISNNHNVPTEFAYLDPFWKDLDIQPVRLDHLHELRQQFYIVPHSFKQAPTTIAFDLITRYIDTVVLCEKYGEDHIHQTRANFLQELTVHFPEIEPEDWAILMQKTETSYEDSNLEKRSSESPESKISIAKDFLREFFSKDLVKQITDPELEDIRLHIYQGDIRRAYWKLGKFLNENLDTVSPEWKKEFQDLCQHYEEVSDRIDGTELEKSHEDEPMDAETPSTKALGLIDQHWPEIRHRIESHLTQWEKRLEKAMPVAKRISFDQVFENKDTTYFGTDITMDDISCVQQFQRHSILLKVQEELAFNLSNISLRSQVFFIRYLSHATTEQYETLKEVLKKIPVEDHANFFTTFLSGAEDSALPEMVVSIAATLEAADSSKIFQHYATLVSETDNLRIYLEKLAGKDRTHSTTEIQSSGLVVTKANALLRQIANGGQDSTGPEVDKVLSRFSVDAALFSAAARTLGTQDVDITTLTDTSLEQSSGLELSLQPNDTERIEKLIQEAYENQPAEFRDAVINSYRAALQNPDSRFYVLRYNGEPVSALRFDDQREAGGEITEKYFGSLISDPSYGNGKLGEAVFEKALKKESAIGVPIHANCNPLSPITQKYIESGFAATALEDYAGVSSFAIEYSEEKNSAFETKKWSVEEVVSAALHQNTESILAFSASRPDEIPFEKVNEGYALTRYFKQGTRLYAVFEKGVA